MLKGYEQKQLHRSVADLRQQDSYLLKLMIQMKQMPISLSQGQIEVGIADVVVVYFFCQYRGL
jgi:hypothetical protein